ncbi:RluA family pseudouridine synthase [Oleisolibacter albus]|uniref:RluA family pseudouridine synthase n=1 Tax=Oleisolibacter albus TaxID=2171757 RepID=UPI000DF16D2A|nr:RNA pseudouridine synthase [Oleisolibacter albus]
MTPLDLESRLLHRDGLMLILDKPAGVAVHAGPGGGDNLERHFEALRFGLPRPPALAHRLDRDTSGCLVLGRHPKALRKLGILFQDGRVKKTYWAAVLGGPAGDGGSVDAALAKRSDARRGWRMIVAEDGQKAVTEWRVLGRASLPGIGPIAFLELNPLTGRTHQIRVHCQLLGCPVLGDPVYGGKPQTPEGQALALHLHSRSITVPIQASKPPVTAVAPVPPHMRAALAACGWAGEAVSTADAPADAPVSPPATPAASPAPGA